jgi:hypothetical protein
MHRLITGSDHRERNERIDFAGYSSRSALLPYLLIRHHRGPGWRFPLAVNIAFCAVLYVAAYFLIRPPGFVVG